MLVALTDGARRHAANDLPWRDRFNDNGPCCSDAAFAKTGAIQHGNIGTQPYAVTDSASFACPDALLGDPPVLLLDEPTRGLDARQISQFRSLLDELRGNHTLLLSSHVLGEVEQLCDRICVISKGKIRLEEDRESWTQRLGKAGRWQLELAPSADAKKVTQWLNQQPEVQSVKRDQHHWSIQSDAALGLRIGEKALEEGWVIMELRSEPATLESLFLEWTGTDLGTPAKEGEGS